MADQVRPVHWMRILAALVVFPFIGPFVLGVTVELVTAVGSLFVEPYVPGEVSFHGIVSMVWLGY